MKKLLFLSITVSMLLLNSCILSIVKPDRISDKKISLSPSVVKNFTDDYQNLPYPLYFAVSENGRYSVSWRCNYSECNKVGAYERVLKYCDKIGLDGKCKIYYQGKKQLYNFPMVTEETLGTNIVFPSKSISYGHQKAKGIIFYFPGYSGSLWPPALNNEQLPKYVKTMNKNGFDIAKVNIPFYNRSPLMIPDIAIFISELFNEYKTMGYKKIVFAGQSRGAWSILYASRHIDSPNVYYILAAPAAHGKKEKSQNFKNQNPEFKTLINSVKKGNLAFFFFQNDPFDAGKKAEIITDNISSNAITMIIDAPINHTGHGSAWSHLFDITYTQNLINFIQGETIINTEKTPNLKNWEEITTNQHVIDSGAKEITGKKLKELLDESTIFNPKDDYNKYGCYIKNSPSQKNNLKTEIQFPGSYLRGNSYNTTCHIKNDIFKIFRKDINSWENYKVFQYNADIYFRVRDEDLRAYPFKVKKGYFFSKN
ncbi:MAG: hypothetical protein KAI40_04140 [Desulfobacterales bacterium]|nr:hypothetical protein [Desulfobacterales bacterium]